MSPALGDSPQQGMAAPGMEEGLFSHLLGLVLLRVARLLAGAVGHRKQRGEGCQGGRDPPAEQHPDFRGVRGKVRPSFGSRNSSPHPN